MAWNDPYGTAAEYRARVGKESADHDTDILEQIQAVSDLTNKRCHRQFNQTSEVARTFTRTSPLAVSIPDLVSLADEGFAVDTTLDGTFDTTIANGDLLLLPTQASEDPDPYTRIELHPKQQTITALPTARHAIEITGTWGWAAVPNAILERVYAIVRELRDLQEAGYTLTLQNVDAAVAISPRGPALMNEIVRLYGRPRMVM